MAMMKPFFTASLTLILSAVLLSACSLNEGEPRVTVCQKVVQKLLDVPNIDWQESHTETEALSKITVTLLLSVTDKTENDEHKDTLSAVCVYAYNDIAEYDVVGQEYESSPTDVYINDKMVGRYTLTKIVNSVMGDAVKGLFE